LICPSYNGSLESESGHYSDSGIKPSNSNYKAIGATDLGTLNDSDACKSPTIGVSGNGGGLLQPYGKTRTPKATSLTLLLVETREADLSAWADGVTASVWGFDPEGNTNINKTLPDQMTYAVSSEHPGAVVVSMADGSARVLTDDISPAVYRGMITKDSRDNSEISEYFSSGG
jgi:hypothetical protein